MIDLLYQGKLYLAWSQDLGTCDEHYDILALETTLENPITGRQESRTETIISILKDIRKKFANVEKKQIYLGYHITDRPMSWEEVTTFNVAKTLGFPDDIKLYHRYSDLTGYLWTDIRVEDSDGHDLYAELESYIQGTRKPRYLLLRAKEME